MSPGQRRPGARIAVYGPAGAGKSTLARELGARLGLSVIELDDIRFSSPGWRRPTREAYEATLEQRIAAANGRWIVEGNDTATDDRVLARCETAIWLRLPFLVTYPRVVRRSVRRVVTKEPLWGGNTTSWRSLFLPRSMLTWSLADWPRCERRTARRLRERPPGCRVVILRSQREIDAYLAQVHAELDNSGGEQ